MKLNKRRPTRHRQQTGVVLIVAMVMLVIIGLASAAIMRNALSSDILSDNNRRQTYALQSAQAALRFCEGLAQNSSPIVAAAAESTPQENWQTFGNWQLGEGATAPQRVSAEFLSTSTSTRTTLAAASRPQCMAQFRNVGTGTSLAQVVVVTARGFSENHVTDAQGRTVSGAVVWLQSIIQLGSSSSSTP